MVTEEEIRNIFKDNLAFYRKANGYTQAKLASILGYSNKAISKWETGEGLPDIVVLKRLADLFEIDVDDLITARKKHPVRDLLKKHLSIVILSVGLCWLVATSLYVILNIITNNLHVEQVYFKSWFFFLYGLLASFIILEIFSKLWGKRIQRFFIVSGINWSAGAIIKTQLAVCNVKGATYFWAVCGVLEILIIFWYFLKGRLFNK